MSKPTTITYQQTNKMNNSTTYQPLGNYIRQVDVRNKDLKVERLLGVSISKEFIHSIANTIGTDMSNYKIVQHDQFAYGPVTSRNGDKVSVALLKDVEDAIISQAYIVFEIVDVNLLCPEYLMMWFRRPEFDRYARFHSHGSAREIFDWQEMCDVMLPIPSIERQREIVAQYETLSRRIQINEQLISKLEATAQALYHKTFVQGIDKQNLPPGWRLGTLEEVADCFDKKRVPLDGYERETMKKIYPYYGASTLMDFVEDYIFDGRYILMGEDGSVMNLDKTPVLQYVEGKFWVNNHAHVLKGKGVFDDNLLYVFLKNTNVEHIITGGVQAKINQENMNSLEVVIPTEDILKTMKQYLCPIFRLILNIRTQINYISKLKELLLDKLSLK